MQSKTLAQLAEHVGGKVKGNGDVVIESTATLKDAGPNEITFLNSGKYISQAKTTKAAAIITSTAVETNASLLIADDAYYAFMQIVVLLHGHRRHKDVGISSNACISDSAKIGDNCNIHGFATISDDAHIGKNCQIYPNVFIGPNVRIGDDCIIYPNAVIYDHCQIGSNVIIHANTTIGEDGFGFATHQGVHHKIPQIGRVILEDDVEVGSGSAIERGTLEDTVIGKGAKIGDMVTIGHGAKIGPYSLLVPQVGVAGSATLGHHCVVGGQVGIAGHIKIGDMVRIAAQSGVGGDVPDGATIYGSPAIEANLGKRAYTLIKYLPDFRKKIRLLEKRLDKLQNPED